MTSAERKESRRKWIIQELLKTRIPTWVFEEILIAIEDRDEETNAVDSTIGIWLDNLPS